MGSARVRLCFLASTLPPLLWWSAPRPATAPSRIEQVELVCLEHLDIGFTAAPQEIARRQKEHLDHAIELCEERADLRWTVESVWQLEQWLARTPEPEQRARLVGLVKDGRIEVAGGFANFHTGVMDAELLLRAFEPAQEIRETLGIEIASCVQDDVPGFSALLPAAMAGSGIRWFLAGVNTAFGGGTSIGPERNPFWWEGLDGSRVLTWVAHGSYVEAERLGLGVWSKDGDAERLLPAALAELERKGYPHRRVLVMASTGDNGDPFAARSILRKVDAWNAAHDSPKVTFTTPGRFFAQIEAEAAEGSGAGPRGFPVFRGDWSGHWERVKLNAPRAMALYREGQALLAGAEALSLRASRELGAAYPQHDLDGAFRRLLEYSEHSQSGTVGWPKLTRKDEIEAANHYSFALAHDAAEALRAIVRRATEQFAERVASGGAAVVLANPVSFARAAEFERGGTRHAAGAIPGFAFLGVPIESLAEREVAAAPRELLGLDRLHALSSFDTGSRIVGVGGAAEGEPLEGLALLPVPAIAPGRGARFTTELDRREIARLAGLGDPFMLMQHLALDASFDARGLRFTTAAGVIGPEDFLPGSLPSGFCTTGAIEITAAPRIAESRSGDSDPGSVGRRQRVTLLLREPFSFQWGRPRWLGGPELDGARDLWIELLHHAMRGETKDRGVVDFPRIEPALDDRLAFDGELFVAETGEPTDPSTDPSADGHRAQRDADLMREAWAFRCPLVTHEHAPWFPSEPSDAGTMPLVTVDAPTVLVLACRPARRGDPRDVIVRLQEIGGIAVEGARIRLALPGVRGARLCDLLERPTPAAPLPAEPVVPLAPHGILTLRFDFE